MKTKIPGVHGGVRMLILAGLVLAAQCAWAQTYSITDLGTLQGDKSSAYAINSAGEIVGQSSTSSGAEHAFLYTRREP